MDLRGMSKGSAGHSPSGISWLGVRGQSCSIALLGLVHGEGSLQPSQLHIYCTLFASGKAPHGSLQGSVSLSLEGWPPQQHCTVPTAAKDCGTRKQEGAQRLCKVALSSCSPSGAPACVQIQSNAI